MKYKTLVTVPIDHMPEVMKTLESCGQVDYLIHPKKEQLLEKIPEYHAIYTNTFNKIDDELLDKAENLMLVETPSTGTDHIDKKACERHNVKWQSLTKDYDVLFDIPSTAELAVTLMLSILRNMKGATKSVLNNKWDYVPYRGREILNLKIGIIGFGRLGKIFSRLVSGFLPELYVYDPFVKVENEKITQVNSLEELFKNVEVIVIHVHLNDSTKHMFNKELFKKMNRGTYLVNTSRGGLIKSEDLIWALEEGIIKSAGLDVIEGEVGFETKENPLIEYAKNHDNLLITPHMGGMTHEAQNKAFGYAAKKLKEFFNDK